MDPAPPAQPVDARPHAWRISEREYARHEARRGRRHAYVHLEPARTALVVVDMVPFFARDNPYVRGIVANVNALARALRSAGGTVAWVLPTTGPPTSRAAEFYGPSVAAMYAASGGEDGGNGGADGNGGAGGNGEARRRHRLWPALDSAEDDVWVEKSASSAFFPGRCDLPDVLAARGIDTVLVTGTVTSVCCDSSARDASTLGLRVVMVADATADVGDEAHNATLRVIYRSFGDVRPTAEVLDLIAAGSPDPTG
jgi:nicotinamidase-related amidase